MRRPPQTVFFKVVLPLILPGVISGGLFAFVTSFDEVIVILFIGGPEQRTLPRQMFSGIRELIHPDNYGCGQRADRIFNHPSCDG